MAGLRMELSVMLRELMKKVAFNPILFRMFSTAGVPELLSSIDIVQNG
jgi:hypothetical protein